jgi:hypothetical protein
VNDARTGDRVEMRFRRGESDVRDDRQPAGVERRAGVLDFDVRTG